MMDYGVTMPTKSEDAPVGKAPSISKMVKSQTDILCETFSVLNAINELLYGERLGEWKDEQPKCLEQELMQNIERASRIRARLIDLHERLSD